MRRARQKTGDEFACLTRCRRLYSNEVSVIHDETTVTVGERTRGDQKMKTRLWGIGIPLIGCAAAMACVTYQYPTTTSAPPAPVVEPAGGSDQPFYDDLAPYGRWVYVSGPGWVWSPYSVQAGWRPYQLGHWVFTDYGWTWSSDEDWGWAVYHYGRWHQDSSYGWVWVPGTEWGPAWVAWHEGGGYVGWAPLPWQVRVQAGVGLDWASVNVTISPTWWCFASARYLVDPGLRTHIVPPARNVTLIQVTKNVTNYTYVDNRIVNQGVRVETIGRAVGHTIPRYRVAESDSPETTRGGKVRGQDFVVFRHDPPRGRNSQGRVDPPGHDDRERPRDIRPGETRPETAPPATQPETAPPTTTQGQQTQDHGRQPHQSRGRKFLDEMMGKQPPRRGPQGTAPAPPAAPDQPSTSTPQPHDATAPPTENRPAGPPQGERQNATKPPTRPEPPKGQTASEKAKEARGAAAKGRKPKQNAPKPDDSKPDDPKKEKPDSGN
jgi:hypothetical protein